MIEMLNYIRIKKFFVLIVVVVIVFIALMLVIIPSMIQSTLVLKNKEFTVEYGQQISKEIKDYLDLDKTDSDKKNNIFAKAKLNINIENQTDKQYPAVGEYNASIIFEKDEVNFKIIIKDTTAPTFKDFKETVETAKDVKPDYTKLYQADDLSQVEITCEDANVKYETVGEYKAKIKAIDTSKNEISKEIIVKVTEPTIKLSKSNLSLYVKETVILKPEIKGKEQKATFKSSNDKIASVDGNGKVTAKKSGTATITVSANGKDATCKVTVKTIPSGSTTEKKIITNPTTGKKEEVIIVKPSAPKPSLSPKISMEAINLINAERAKRGKPALKYDAGLADIALKRAKEIQTDFSHDGIYKYGKYLGEVLAMQDFGNFPVKAVVKGWMNSTAHRKILMDDYDLGDTTIAVAYLNNRWVGITGGR